VLEDEKAFFSIVACLLAVFLGNSAWGAQWVGYQVGVILLPDARPSLFFQLTGVSQVDPVAAPNDAWMAIPETQDGYTQIYAMLLSALRRNGPRVSQNYGPPSPVADDMLTVLQPSRSCPVADCCALTLDCASRRSLGRVPAALTGAA
jgi:hypothetical protein